MSPLLKYILFCLFHVQQIHNAPSSSHYQIDEFIGQLMTSEKFGELADVIAEKAANKIRTIEINNITTLRHSYQSKPKDRPRYKKSLKDNQSHGREDPMVKEETKENKENSGKFGKINTKAFLKHDVSSQELYLNYKHITKNKEAKLSSKNDSKYPDINGSDDNIFSDHSTEQSKLTSKENSMNIESKKHKNIRMKSIIDESFNDHSILSDGLSSDNKDKDPISNKTTSKKVTQNIESNQGYSEEDNTLGVTKKENNNAGKKYKNSNKLQATKTNIDDGDASSDSSHFESKKDTRTDHTKESQEHKSPDDSSKEVVEVGINRAFTDVSSEHFINKNLDILDKEEKHQAKNPIETKQIIRRENGKLYTFISSPDYDDYHENVGKLKTRNNYINTYK